MKKWDKKEVAFLQENYRKLGPTACARALQRPGQSIENKARRLGLQEKNRAYRPWEAWEIDFLRTHHEKGPTWCAKHLGRPLGSVRGRVSKLLDFGDLDDTAIHAPATAHTCHTCVDCGTPTPDHRCPRCWAKYRAKYGCADWTDADDVYGVAL